MKNNRRSFLKSVGLSSGALFFSPELGMVNRRELVENELKAKGLHVYRTTELNVDVCVVGGGLQVCVPQLPLLAMDHLLC